jgi:hypothetical protein
MPNRYLRIWGSGVRISPGAPILSSFCWERVGNRCWESRFPGSFYCKQPLLSQLRRQCPNFGLAMPLQTIKWGKQFRVRDDRIIWIAVPKFDECWRLSESGNHYLLCGQGRPAACRRIEDSVKSGLVRPMPHIGFYPDLKRISFTDGRHRFAWVRDHGGRAMPMTINKSQVLLARKLFGSRSRSCEVSHSSSSARV